MRLLLVTDGVVVIHVDCFLCASLSIDAEIDHDAIEPCVKRRCAREFREISVNFDERILRNVHGVFLVSQDPKSDRVDAPLVFFDKRSIRFFVTLKASFDKLCIFLASQKNLPFIE